MVTKTLFTKTIKNERIKKKTANIEKIVDRIGELEILTKELDSLKKQAKAYAQEHGKKVLEGRNFVSIISAHSTPCIPEEAIKDLYKKLSEDVYTSVSSISAPKLRAAIGEDAENYIFSNVNEFGKIKTTKK